MTPTEIIEALEKRWTRYPQEAMEAAMAQREAMVPLLLDKLKDVLADPDDHAERHWDMSHIFATVLLGWFREPSAHAYLIELASLPGNLPFNLFDDFVTEDFSEILWLTSDGQTDALKALALRPEANEFCRSAAMSALVDGVAQGVLDRLEVLEFLAGFLDEDEPYVGGFAAYGLCDLYPGPFADKVRSACEEGLIDPMILNSKSLDEVMKEGEEAVLTNLRHRSQKRLDKTPHDRLSWWACFQPEPKTMAERAVQRELKERRKTEQKRQAKNKKKRKAARKSRKRKK